MKRLALLLTLSIICCVAAFTQEEDKREKWRALIPEFDGTVRAKYEYQPQMKASRFQVRNARFSINGKVHPIAGYKLEIDLSDQGRIRMLDAYARLTPIEGGSFTIGQMRVPFTIDAHRSPHLQYFANRSFIAKQVGDVRDVGFTLEYKFKDFPLILQGGIFNGFDDITYKTQTVLSQAPAEAVSCICKSDLTYQNRYYAHIGNYYCPNCGRKRPKPDYTGYAVIYDDYSEIYLKYKPDKNTDEIKELYFKTNLVGLYNAYNALAAISMALELNIKPEIIQEGLSTYKSVFGRSERRTLNGRDFAILTGSV